MSKREIITAEEKRQFRTYSISSRACSIIRRYWQNCERLRKKEFKLELRKYDEILILGILF